MEYSINKLSSMSGVTTRTLRYYDEIGLLTPARVADSGYRIYAPEQVDTLQQILFYKALGFALDEIKLLLSAPDFDRMQAFENHLQALHQRRKQINQLIANVQKSITTMKGETTMLDAEKFEGFKQKLLADKEKQFGNELREKFGDKAIEGSNANLKAMSQEQYTETEKLLQEVNDTLKRAVAQGDPASELAQHACALHKEWLCRYWSEYTPEMHLGLAQMYVEDPRFTAYYDKIVPGAAMFLRDALAIYC